MLTIKVEQQDFFDSSKNEFVALPPIVLEFEHSLVSLSKWEQKYKKPFLTKEEKTSEESMAYVECMLLTPNVPSYVLTILTDAQVREIGEYINTSQTATWFRKTNEPPSREKVTSELIYYWMTAAQIPWEAQYWHLDRLFTLIKIVSLKSQPAKKMSKSEMLAQRRSLNAQRRAQHNTTG